VDFVTVVCVGIVYGRRVRTTIRLAIPSAALAALVVGIAAPAPQRLPSAALGSREVLWLERTLFLFYGFLLLFVPLLRALAGELPIELSMRGARYADLSKDALGALGKRVAKTEDVLYRTAALVDHLAERIKGEEAES
jgi:hypothetical protein